MSAFCYELVRPSTKWDFKQDSPLIKAELERVAANQPFPSLDSLRYTLPAPSSTPGTDEEWRTALDNAHAQLQHQRIRYANMYLAFHISYVHRQQNLALLQTYGSNAWRIQNYLLEATAKQTEKSLEELKELTVEVNRERKNMQVCCYRLPVVMAQLILTWLKDRYGKQLTSLETRWTELISSVLQIEMANVALDAEIDKLNKREAELAEL